MRAETVAEQLFFTTTRLEAQKGQVASVGTGFVVAVETPQGTVHSLVTNRHVLDGADEVLVRMVRKDGDTPMSGAATEITARGLTSGSWVGHPDPSVDVAVMPLAPIVDAMAAIGGEPFFRAITPDLFADEALLIRLDAIEQVTFIGYPSGLYDTENFLPIARRGTSATPLDVDYQGRPMFLIDASVFPGSSGSPVFLLDRGMYADRKGGTVVGSRFALLGIVAAVHVRLVSGQVAQVTTGLEATFVDPIGLGMVFRASTIMECIDQMLAGAGLERIEEAPTAEPGELTDADETVAGEIDRPT